MSIEQRLADLTVAVDELCADPADAAADYRRFRELLDDQAVSTPPEPPEEPGAIARRPPTFLRAGRHIYTASAAEREVTYTDVLNQVLHDMPADDDVEIHRHPVTIWLLDHVTTRQEAPRISLIYVPGHGTADDSPH